MTCGNSKDIITNFPLASKSSWLDRQFSETLTMLETYTNFLFITEF